MTCSSHEPHAHDAFRVLRLDANGNEFVTATRRTREQAEALVREFEARGHKQTYWIERSTDDESH